MNVLTVHGPHPRMLAALLASDDLRTSWFFQDGTTDLLTILLAGKQDWKCPVPLLQTCCGSKSLKVILIDSDFGAK